MDFSRTRTHGGMQGGKKHEVVPSFSSSQELSQEQSMDVDAQKGWEGQGTVSNPFEMSSEADQIQYVSPEDGYAHSESMTPQTTPSFSVSDGDPTPSLMPLGPPARRRPSRGTSPSSSMSPSRHVDVIEDVKSARRSTIIKQKSKKKSSMACTRCRQLKKKCHVVPGTRCERCMAQDLVCEYKDGTSNPTTPRGPPTAGSAPGLEVEVAQAWSVPSPPSTPPSPTLAILPDMPWAFELSDDEALLYAPRMIHPANHALFKKPPSPEVAPSRAPHSFSQFAYLPSPLIPYAKSLYSGAHHVPDQPYPIDTSGPSDQLLGQYPHDSYQLDSEVINANIHAHEPISSETWLDPNMAFANASSIPPKGISNLEMQLSLLDEIDWDFEDDSIPEVCPEPRILHIDLYPNEDCEDLIPELSPGPKSLALDLHSVGDGGSHIPAMIPDIEEMSVDLVDDPAHI
ncbi:hypothetical protein FIBSPDRAFT_881946 [Athelia psychrophila]|uniref:Zn(2)-C6 fungal-type domain-containing protein n=1 Tax=Athelia psychrophila TaxID=1759441 RepID=A0A166VY06_9AGAM|nr:hypothetical protein FIBSPDRAFT_881946 [Fibularhizoctonia sp. CBS 109695]